MDIMLSSHISIVSHSALFRFLWFRLFCFVLPCCVILCFGGIKPPWGGFIPPKGVVLTRGGGFIPHKGWLYPPKGVVLSPKRGVFIPHKSGHTTTRGGFKGGFIPHLGVVLRPGPLRQCPGNAESVTAGYLAGCQHPLSVLCLRWWRQRETHQAQQRDILVEFEAVHQDLTRYKELPMTRFRGGACVMSVCQGV